MKVYLVGGAVRDELLHLPVKERDWVVVGATVDEMLKKGFRQVGKDFPVFLHPETNEEYALARTERKISPGYTGFDFNASPRVTLEEDLQRRDLTINAIAKNREDGQLIDPYHGRDDLDKKLLRHVSAAFIEDPVRVLRIARFAARFAPLGFKIAKETLHLMQAMVASGEMDALVPERVFKEWERAFGENDPRPFIQELKDCGAMSVLCPRLRLTETALSALKEATQLSTDKEVRLATVLFDSDLADIEQFCQCYKVPTVYRDLALLVAEHLASYLRAKELTPSEWLKLLSATDAFRRTDRFNKFLLSCEAVAKASGKFDAQTPLCSSILDAAKNISMKELLVSPMAGSEIARRVNEKRLEAIEERIRYGLTSL